MFIIKAGVRSRIHEISLQKPKRNWELRKDLAQLNLNCWGIIMTPKTVINMKNMNLTWAWRSSRGTAWRLSSCRTWISALCFGPAGRSQEVLTCSRTRPVCRNCSPSPEGRTCSRRTCFWRLCQPGLSCHSRGCGRELQTGQLNIYNNDEFMRNWLKYLNNPPWDQHAHIISSPLRRDSGLSSKTLESKENVI